MSKKACLILCIILAVVVIGEAIVFTCILNEKKNLPKDATLIINNEHIFTDYVRVRYYKASLYADLPLTEILKCCDMNVEWLNDNTAEITYKDKTYILNYAEVSIIEEGRDNDNLILPLPCGYRVHKILRRELILDSNTINGFLFWLNVEMKIDIDYDSSLVTVTCGN